jgi:chitinase
MRSAAIAVFLFLAASCGSSSTSKIDASMHPPIDAPPGGVDGGGADAGSTPSGLWVLGYYAGYQHTLYPPDTVDWAALTHIVVGPIVPQADGTLDVSFDVDPTTGPMIAMDLADRAHAAGRKALLMIGGAGAHDGFAGAASPPFRAQFEANLIAFATSHHFDGFDLDWEPVDPPDRQLLLPLATELRAMKPGVILTMPVTWVNSNVPGVDPWYAMMAGAVDRMNLMTYGMAGAYSGWKSWHSSAIFGDTSSTPASVDSSVQAYLAAGVPAAKLGVGIGFYGTCWSPPVTGPSQALAGATIIASDNTMSFTNIMSSYYSAAAYQYDATAMAPSLSFATPHGPQGCTWISYEDETSVAAKGQYVKDHGLGGAIIWTINEGYLPGDPLLEAVRAAFLQ